MPTDIEFWDKVTKESRRMDRCLDCDKTIKNADKYHESLIIEHITNMDMYRSFRDEDILHRFTKYICCNCLHHEVGECEEERAKQAFYEEFKKAIVRSSGGVSRAGFLS